MSDYLKKIKRWFRCYNCKIKFKAKGKDGVPCPSCKCTRTITIPK